MSLSGKSFQRSWLFQFPAYRIALGKEKNRKARLAKKLITAKRDAAFVPSTELLQPTESAPEKEKIKVLASTSKKRSAMIPGEGRSMGMDLD